MRSHAADYPPIAAAGRPVTVPPGRRKVHDVGRSRSARYGRDADGPRPSPRGRAVGLSVGWATLVFMATSGTPRSYTSSRGRRRAGHLQPVDAAFDARRAQWAGQARARRRSALQTRIRGGLDGVGIVEITAGLDQLRCYTGGAAAGSDEAADLEAVARAYQDVLDWLLDNDQCVYHGRLG